MLTVGMYTRPTYGHAFPSLHSAHHLVNAIRDPLVRSIPHRLVLTQWATVKLSVLIENAHWQTAANALHYDQNSNESVHQQAQTSSRTTTQNHLEGPS